MAFLKKYIKDLTVQAFGITVRSFLKCCLKPLKCRFESCVLHMQFEYFSIIKKLYIAFREKI